MKETKMKRKGKWKREKENKERLPRIVAPYVIPDKFSFNNFIVVNIHDFTNQALNFENNP